MTTPSPRSATPLAVLRAPLFWLALVPGLVALALPRPAVDIGLDVLLLKAFAEELFFRAGLQSLLSRILAGRSDERAAGRLEWLRLGPVSPANLLASVLFALAHLWLAPSPFSLMAALTFFPSLVFGWLWDRYGSVVPCWLCHFFYNACLFFPI